MYTVWTQAGPVASVNIPESKDDNRPRFGFCHYQSVVSHISDIPDNFIFGSSREATACSMASAGVCKICSQPLSKHSDVVWPNYAG